MTITATELIDVFKAYRSTVKALHVAIMATKQDLDLIAYCDDVVTGARQDVSGLCRAAVAEGWTPTTIAVAIGGKPSNVAKFVI